jgi:hypothetical protein
VERMSGLKRMMPCPIQDHDIRFKLFNPSKSVRERLTKGSSMSEFDIPTLDEMVALLARADSRYRVHDMKVRVKHAGFPNSPQTER